MRSCNKVSSQYVIGDCFLNVLGVLALAVGGGKSGEFKRRSDFEKKVKHIEEKRDKGDAQ